MTTGPATRAAAVVALVGYFSFLWWGPYARTVGLAPAVVVPAVLVVAAPLVWHALSTGLIRGVPVAMLAFGGWAVLSVAWTRDPLIGGFWLAVEALPVLLVWIAASLFPTAKVLRLVRITLAVAIGVALVWTAIDPRARVAPEAPYDLGWRGGFISKNILGILVTTGALMWLGACRTLAARATLVVGAAGLCLATRSATACVGLAAGVAVWGLLRTNGGDGADRPRITARWGLWSAALVGAGSAASIAVATWLGKDLTFNRRSEVWRVVLRRVGERPLQGHGAGTWVAPYQEFTRSMDRHIGFVASHAHNGALDVLLAFGLVGVLLMGAFLAGALLRAGMALPSDGADPLGRTALTVLAAILVMSAAEPTFRYGTLGLVAVLWAVLDGEARSTTDRRTHVEISS